MKLSIDSGGLATLTAAAAKALPSRPPVPVLAGLLLSAADNGTLTVAAYDYETSVTTTGNAEVGEPGQVLVPGRLLGDIAKALPKNRPVTLHLDGSRLQLTAGTARFTIPVLPLDEYPALPKAPSPFGAVDAEQLAGAVAQTAAVLARDDTLPILTGIYIEIDAERSGITLAATDRYRFAVRHLPATLDPAAALPAPRTPAKTDAPQTEPRLPAILVPGRTLADAARLLGTGTIHLATDGQILALSNGQAQVTTRLLDGEFPRWRAIFPTSADFTCTVQANRADWADALGRVALVLDRNVPIRLHLDQAGQQLEFHAGTGDDAQAVDLIPADITGDADLDVAFNPRYLAEALATLDADIIRAAFTTPTKPALLTTAGDHGPDAAHQHLLMPVRQS